MHAKVVFYAVSETADISLENITLTANQYHDFKLNWFITTLNSILINWKESENIQPTGFAVC